MLMFLSLIAFGGQVVGTSNPAHCTSLGQVNPGPPGIVGPLYHGDTVLNIHNQMDGEIILIGSAIVPLMHLEMAKDSSSFTIPSSLLANDVVSACQTGFCSDGMPVLDKPAYLDAPYGPYVPKVGAEGMTVTGVHPGAVVEVFANGVRVGKARADHVTAVNVALDPTLPAGTVLRVRQSINSLVSPWKNITIDATVSGLAMPTVQGPVRRYDTSVHVAGVTPGSLVEIIDPGTGDVLGGIKAGEPMVQVPVCELDSDYAVRVTRNGVVVQGATQILLAEPPSSIGPIWEETYDYGPWTGADPNAIVPTIFKMTGVIYHPVSTVPSNPVVFIVHGNETQGAACGNTVEYLEDGTPVVYTGKDSEKGYSYIAQSLAAMGIVVVSLDVGDNGSLEGGVFSYIDETAQVLVDTIAEVKLQLSEVDDLSPMGFIGHSNGGDAVIYARTLIPASTDLRAIVALAPNSYGVDPVVGSPWGGWYAPPTWSGGPTPAYLQLVGTEDLLLGWVSAHPREHSLYQYDRAWNDRTLLFVDGLGHYGFNTCWTTEDGDFDPLVHQQIAYEYAVPFLWSHLGDPSWDVDGYYTGAVKPQGMSKYDIDIEYHDGANAHVVDTFGEPGYEHVLLDENLLVDVNSRGGAVVVSAPGGAVAPVELTNSPTDATEKRYPTDAYVRLDWSSRQFEYTSSFSPLFVGSNDVLSLVARREGSDLNGEAGHPQDFMVGVGDGNVVAYVRAGSVSEVTGQVTIRLPMSAFQAIEPSLVLSNIQSVHIQPRVRESGVMRIYHVEFSQ